MQKDYYERIQSDAEEIMTAINDAVANDNAEASISMDIGGKQLSIHLGSVDVTEILLQAMKDIKEFAIEQRQPGNNCKSVSLPYQKAEPVPTVSLKVLYLLRSCINEKDAAAPNTIEELVYAAIVDDMEAGCLPEDIAEAASNLAGHLVKDVGQYY